MWLMTYVFNQTEIMEEPPHREAALEAPAHQWHSNHH
jgi:hypothetical protein